MEPVRRNKVCNVRIMVENTIWVCIKSSIVSQAVVHAFSPTAREPETGLPGLRSGKTVKHCLKMQEKNSNVKLLVGMEGNKFSVQMRQYV